MKKVETSNLPEVEFKTLIIRMFSNLSENVNQETGNMKMEIGNIKQQQVEMKNTLIEIKKTLQGINS